MAGAVKLAIILTATMRGGEAFDRAGGGIRGIGAAAKAATPMLAAFAGYAAFNFLKDSIKLAREFEQVMAEAGSIIGQTADEVKVLGDEIREMSKRVPKSPRDLGLALYDIFSAGITDTSDAMNALELSAKAASAGLTQTATAAKAGISTMNAFGMEASELEHIFDVQFLTIKFGILRYEELAAVVGQLAPAAKASGQSMESMFAALAQLTKKGLNAAEASTALARAMEGITRPAAIRAAEELGISFVTMSEDAIRARDEFLRQKRALDDLETSYESTEARVKQLGEAMDELSLEEAKNRLEITKIRREAEKEERDLTDDELDRIDELEQANKDLSIQYEEISVAQREVRIEGAKLSNQMDEQKIATEEATKAFDEQVAISGDFRPLVDIIKEIGDKYGHLGEAARADIISKMFPQIRAKRAVLSIIGSEEELMATTDMMMSQAGAMGEAYAINTDTAAAGHQLMQNAVEDLQITIGEELMPITEMWHEIMIESIIPMIKNAFLPILESLMPILKVMAEVIGWIAGVFADYPELLWAIIGAIIAWKIAQWALNIAMMANPIGLIIMAIAGLIALIVILIKNFDMIIDAFKKVGDGFMWVWENAIKPVVDVIMEGVDIIVGGLTWLWEQFTKLGEIISWVYKTFLKPVFDTIIWALEKIGQIAQWLKDAFGWVIDIAKGVVDFLFGGGEEQSEAAKQAGGFGVAGFQRGGVVTEPTLGLLGEAGAEAVIPLRGGAIPVRLEGGNLGGDEYNITIEAGALPTQETPESLTQKIVDGLKEAKMRGTNTQV